MITEFMRRANEYPVIGAIGNNAVLDEAIKSDCEILFFLSGSIFDIADNVKRAKDANKMVFVHLDLLEGFSRDAVAVEYLCKRTETDGIITTKSSMIKVIKSFDKISIQRLFLIDSLNFDTGIKSVTHTQPDAVEILPGIMHHVTEQIVSRTRTPIVTGGLIQSKEDIIMGLKAGAVAVSTSNSKLWGL